MFIKALQPTFPCIPILFLDPSFVFKKNWQICNNMTRCQWKGDELTKQALYCPSTSLLFSTPKLYLYNILQPFPLYPKQALMKGFSQKLLILSPFMQKLTCKCICTSYFGGESNSRSSTPLGGNAHYHLPDSISLFHNFNEQISKVRHIHSFLHLFVNIFFVPMDVDYHLKDGSNLIT